MGGRPSSHARICAHCTYNYVRTFIATSTYVLTVLYICDAVLVLPPTYCTPKGEEKIVWLAIFGAQGQIHAKKLRARFCTLSFEVRDIMVDQEEINEPS